MSKSATWLGSSPPATAEDDDEDFGLQQTC
jgi:hypothetical protein